MGLSEIAWLTPPLGLLLQAVFAAPAAPVPPALSRLCRGRGAPFCLFLRVLQGQRHGGLQGRHAGRGELCARPPLCWRKCPEKEAGAAAAATGEQRMGPLAPRMPLGKAGWAQKPLTLTLPVLPHSSGSG